MKGLLLKDLYLTLKYCKVYIAMIVMFSVFSCFNNMVFGTHDMNMFFWAYPCMFASILPTTLYAYDEREKWCTYSQTLPVTRAQYVSAKYIMGLIFVAAVTVLTGTLRAVQMIRTTAFEMHDYLSVITLILSISLILPSVLMPLMFKFGTEKARLLYYVLICMSFSLTGTFFSLDSVLHFADGISDIAKLLIACFLVAGIYIGSWLLSIHVYKKREI